MVVYRDNSLAIHHCSGNVLPQKQILILTAHFVTILEELWNAKRTSNEPSDELMMEPCCALKYYPAVEVCQNEKVATFMDDYKIMVTIHIISIVHIIVYIVCIVVMIIVIIHVCTYIPVTRVSMTRM